MPAVPTLVSAGDCRRGGVIGYPLEQLYQEVAFVAYHFHWPHDEVMDMEHPYRRRWVEEISAINQEMSVA